VVNPGQKWLGGEVSTEVRRTKTSRGVRGTRRAYAFDYVGDVMRHEMTGGRVSYDVFIRRCCVSRRRGNGK